MRRELLDLLARSDAVVLGVPFGLVGAGFEGGGEGGRGGSDGGGFGRAGRGEAGGGFVR